MKTEPDEFSIDHLKQRKREPWSGVRNYLARNFMRDDMKIGDTVLFYHSSCAEPGIYGVGEIVSDAYPDPTQFDPKSDYHDPKSPREAPRWLLVDVGYVRHLARPLLLDALRAEDGLQDMVTLQRGNRLSITPVTRAEYDVLMRMEGRK